MKLASRNVKDGMISLYVVMACTHVIDEAIWQIANLPQGPSFEMLCLLLSSMLHSKDPSSTICIISSDDCTFLVSEPFCSKHPKKPSGSESVTYTLGLNRSSPNPSHVSCFAGQVPKRHAIRKQAGDS